MTASLKRVSITIWSDHSCNYTHYSRTYLHYEGGSHPNHGHGQDERVPNELIYGHSTDLHQHLGSMFQFGKYGNYVPINGTVSCEDDACLQHAATVDPPLQMARIAVT
eukprot:2870004-Pyramimonas_sp.AAC.2